MVSEQQMKGYRVVGLRESGLVWNVFCQSIKFGAKACKFTRPQHESLSSLNALIYTMGEEADDKLLSLHEVSLGESAGSFYTALYYLAGSYGNGTLHDEIVIRTITDGPRSDARQSG